MATQHKVMLADNSTDDNFRQWGKSISDAITALGWVHSVDTQINWSTVTAPAQNTFSTSVEIWQNNDSILPNMFIKIRYGSSNNATPAPAIAIQCGTGSDGSGNLTGTGMAEQTMMSGTVAGQGSNVYFNSFFSGNGVGGRLAMMLYSDFSSGSCGFMVERSRDNTGVATTAYFTWITFNHGYSTSLVRQNSIFGSGSVMGASTPTATLVGCCTITLQNVSEVGSAGIPIFPIYPVVGYVGNPITSFVELNPNDVVNNNGTLITSQLYNTSMKYLLHQGNVSSGFDTITGIAFSAVGMRYD